MKRSVFLGITLFLAAVSQMFAAPDMRLTLNADGTICNVDVNGAVATLNGSCGTLTATVVGPSHGQLLVNGNLGNYRVSDTANGFMAAVLPALQDLNQLDVECAPNPAAATCNGGLGVGGNFTATFTDTSVPTQTSIFGFSTSIVAGTSTNITGSVDFAAFVDPANIIPATHLIAAVTLVGPSANSNQTAPNPAPGVPYSLTTQEALHFNHNGSIQANAEISSLAVPEPASIMLMGTMLLLTSVGLRRKLRRG